MNWKISILFSTLAFLGFAQEVNQVDSKGRKQGKWEKVHPGTRVYIYRGQFKDDKPVGKFTYFYKSAKVKAVIEHSETSNRATGYFYHEKGGIMSYGIYRNMKKDSVWTNVDVRGRLSSRETYYKDSLHGPKVVFYPPPEPGVKKQAPSMLCNYEMGKRVGEYKEYFESGNIKIKGHYKDGQKSGEWTTYHPGGRKMMFERYKEGNRHGWCSAFDKSGKETGKKYYYYGRHLEGKALKRKMEQMKELGINPNE